MASDFHSNFVVAVTAMLVQHSKTCGATVGRICAPGRSRFLCGAQRPEDVVRIPGTRWLIYSGFSNGAGLKLVDSVAQTMRPLTYESPGAHEKRGWIQCDTPPDSATFSTQGLSIRDLGGSLSRLHVVNHGGRESVEIFSVDARTDEPRFTWSGCVLMPPGLAANSVATFSDGTILVSVLTHPGRTITDFWRGEITGAVYSWKPGEDCFRLLPGTELPGNNGLETSRDDTGVFRSRIRVAIGRGFLACRPVASPAARRRAGFHAGQYPLG